MKKVFLMGLMAIFMIGAVKAQDTKEEPTSGAKIEFTKKEHTKFVSGAIERRHCINFEGRK